MKKVVLIIRSAQKGGVENHVYKLLSRACSYGYEAVLISLADVPVDDKFKNIGIEVCVTKDTQSMSVRSLLNIFHVYRELMRLRPDIVHCHGTRPIFIGTLASKLAGIKTVIVTVHNSFKLMSYDCHGRVKRSLLVASKIMHWIGLSLSDCVISVSQYLMTELRSSFILKQWFKRMVQPKIRIIHNGIDTDVFKYIEDKQHLSNIFGICNGMKVIGTVGRLSEPLKGITVLLMAVKHLFDRGYRFEVMIVGDGYSRMDIQKLCKTLCVGEHIHFMGYHEAPVNLYNLMDVFVLPSLSEGFPLVNLEAMACRRAVISTDVGGVSEALKHSVNGLLVQPNNAEALAIAMEDLLNNEKMRLEIGFEAEKTVRMFFTEEQMLNKVFAVYKEFSANE